MMVERKSRWVNENQVVQTLCGWLIEATIRDGIQAYHSDLWLDCLRVHNSFEEWLQTDCNPVKGLSAPQEIKDLVFMFRTRSNGCGTDLADFTTTAKEGNGPHSAKYWLAGDGLANEKPQYRLTVSVDPNNIHDGKWFGGFVLSLVRQKQGAKDE